MAPHLILVFDAPAASFGGTAIDNLGVVADFPLRSMLSGLLANALGYDRTEADRLDALQARLVHAAALVRAGHRQRDYQTARLFEKDAGWTTRGTPEGRAPSPSFTWDDRYEAERGSRLKSLTHQRHRDFDADARTLVALRLDPPDADPDLDALAAALERPERPLFIGRKPHLPSRPLLAGLEDAPDPLAALAHRMAAEGFHHARTQWATAPGAPIVEGGEVEGDGFALRIARRCRVADERRHRTGVHAGDREVWEGEITLRDRVLDEATS